MRQTSGNHARQSNLTPLKAGYVRLNSHLQCKGRARRTFIRSLYLISPLLCLLTLSLAPRLWSAQSSGFRIEGVVEDPAGSPVPDARVSITSGGASTSTLTDREGRFILSDLQAAEGTLTVQAKGFEVARRPWRSQGQPTSKVTIVLSIRPLPQQMTVTATRTQTLVSQTAGSVQVLSGSKLDSTAALTLDDTLRQIPGFTLFRRTGSRVANPTTQGVSLRGVGASGASRALVLENGFPLNDPFGGWVYWDRVPRAAVDRIEIAEGGASDLYGSDAMGGVINILTRRANHSEVSLDASYGNEDTPDASLWSNTTWGRWGAQIEAEAFNTDGYVLVPEDTRGPVDTAAGSSHTDLDLTLDRQISDHARAFVGGTVFGEARKNGTPLQTNRTHLRGLTAGLDWQTAQWGSFTVRGYGEAQVYDQTFSSIAPAHTSETLTILQRVPAQETGYSVQWTRPWGLRQTWVAGIEGTEVRGASNELHYLTGAVNSAVGSGGRQDIRGIFAEDIIRPTSRWILTASGRFDSWRNFDALSTTRPLASPAPISVINFPARSANAFSPHLSALCQISSTTSIYASAYKAFRAPTLNELYRPFRVGNVLTLANSTLGAEHLTGAEIGAAWRPVKDRFRVHASLFWNEIRQPVANVTLAVTPNLITRQRQNLGSTRSRGLEVEAETEVRPGLVFSGGYQFVDATVLSFPANTALQGLRIPQVPQNVFTFQARYTRSRLLTLALQGRYTGIQYDDDLNQFPLGRAFTLDAFVSHPVRNRAEIYGALENLTDQRYEVARVPYTELGPPILARIGFRLNWGAR
jgi:outer membrane receptor protein involved in Fe transport